MTQKETSVPLWKILLLFSVIPILGFGTPYAIFKLEEISNSAFLMASSANGIAGPETIQKEFVIPVSNPWTFTVKGYLTNKTCLINAGSKVLYLANIHELYLLEASEGTNCNPGKKLYKNRDFMFTHIYKNSLKKLSARPDKDKTRDRTNPK